MNDIDEELRATLQAPPDFAPSPVDIGYIMAAGTRLRRRRQLAVAAQHGADLALRHRQRHDLAQAPRRQVRRSGLGTGPCRNG